MLGIPGPFPGNSQKSLPGIPLKAGASSRLRAHKANPLRFEAKFPSFGARGLKNKKRGGWESHGVLLVFPLELIQGILTLGKPHLTLPLFISSLFSPIPPDFFFLFGFPAAAWSLPWVFLSRFSNFFLVGKSKKSREDSEERLFQRETWRFYFKSRGWHQKKKKKLQKSVPALATFIKSSEFPVPARLKEQNHPKNAFPKEFPYSSVGKILQK